jgi:hypothetical protein
LQRIRVRIQSDSLQLVASDDAFRASQYLEAQKQHKRDVAANKAEKDLYKYQEAAKGVLKMEKEAKDLSKKDWETLIRFGVKLKNQDAPFTAILKKDISFLCHYYIEHLQDLVEDEENHIAKPPESISEPNVPSLEETMLEQERQRQMRGAVSLVDSSRPQDLSWLQALGDKVQAKIDGFECEAAEAAAAPTVAPAVEAAPAAELPVDAMEVDPVMETVQTEVAPAAETVEAPLAGANLRVNAGVEGEQD